MPVGHNCLHLEFQPYLSSDTDSCKYEKLPNIFIHACKKYYRKNDYVEKERPGFVNLCFDLLHRNS